MEREVHQEAPEKLDLLDAQAWLDSAAHLVMMVLLDLLDPVELQDPPDVPDMLPQFGNHSHPKAREMTHTKTNTKTMNPSRALLTTTMV